MYIASCMWGFPDCGLNVMLDLLQLYLEDEVQRNSFVQQRHAKGWWPATRKEYASIEDLNEKSKVAKLKKHRQEINKKHNNKKRGGRGAGGESRELLLQNTERAAAGAGADSGVFVFVVVVVMLVWA